ncbi:tyrosine-protein phosphatase [Gordonia sp. NPDC003950]
MAPPAWTETPASSRSCPSRTCLANPSQKNWETRPSRERESNDRHPILGCRGESRTTGRASGIPGGVRAPVRRRASGGPGQLFRSATVQFVDDSGAAALVADTGLKQIIDLRLDYEAAREGSGGFTTTDVAITNVPFAIRKPVAEGSAVAPMTDPDPLVGAYLGYLAAPGAFKRIVDALLADEGTPALIHCTMGKDRTGVAVALILDAIGVLRADIVTDYSARAEDIPLMVDRLARMETYGEAVKVYPPQALRVDGATLLRFLAWLDIDHGGSAAWLNSVGVDDDALDSLADRLLMAGDGPATTQILRSARVPLPAEAAWGIVGDVAGVHRWVPGLAATAVENDVRTATFDDGGQAHELIVAHDDARRSYTHRYLDGPIPLDSYESTITVGPDHDGTGSIVVWNAALQATPEVVAAVAGRYDAGLAKLQE